MREAPNIQLEIYDLLIVLQDSRNVETLVSGLVGTISLLNKGTLYSSIVQ